MSGKTVFAVGQHKLTQVADGETNSDAVTVGQLINTSKTMLKNLVKEGVQFLLGHHSGKPRSENSNTGNLPEDVKTSLIEFLDV